MVPKFEKRVRAFAIDISGLSVALIMSLFLPPAWQISIISVTFVLIYIVPHFFSPGQTFGKRIQQIRVVNMDDTRVSILKSILRELTKMFLTIFTAGIYSVIAFFAITENQVSRTIHDYPFKTKVIDLEKRSSNNQILGKSESLRKKGF